MTEKTRQAIRGILIQRQEAAHRALEERFEYQEVCKEQEESEKKVDTLYQRFDQDELSVIRGHYEGETFRKVLEFEQIYLQGMQD